MNLNPITNIAIIILAVEAILCMLIPLALTIGAAYLMVRTRQFLPPKFHWTRLQFRSVDDAADRAGTAMTQPLMELEAGGAGLAAWARYARSTLRKTTRE